MTNEFNLVPADETTGVYEIPELDGLPYDVIIGAEMFTDASNRANYATGQYTCGNSHNTLTGTDRQNCKDVS
jgi:hypothetical protein